MSIVTTTIALMRHLRAERGMALLLVVVVAFTAFVMAAIPRLYNQTLDDELQYRVAGAPPDWRNISVTKQQRSSVADHATILDRLEAGSISYLDELSASLQEVIDGFGYLTESQHSPVVQTRLQPPLEFNRSLQFRFQGNLTDHITLTDGRWPEVRRPVLLSELTATPGARGEVPVPLYEVAVSEQSLNNLEYERWQLLSVRLNGVGERVYIRIVGVFTVNDHEANYWNADTRLHEPVVAGFATDFGEVVQGVALPPVETYPDMLSRASDQAPWHNEWTFYVGPDRLSLGNYATVSAEIQQLKLSRGPVDLLRRPDERLLASTDVQPQITFPEFDETETGVHNELPLVLERFAEQARLTSSVIALATIGLLGVGLAALGLLTALIADRRRAMVTLLRTRGASRGQLLTARLAEGLLLCMPAAMVGFGVATLVVDARANPWSIRAALATGLLTSVLVVVAAGGNILPRLGTLLSGSRHRLMRPSPRRIMVEALLVVMAAAGILLLRQRGLEPEVESGGVGGFDPFLTAVPVLLALAAGIVLLRLYPFPIRLLAWLARWMRGTVIFMGLRRMASQSTATNLALLVLLLAVGVAVFTSVVAYSVDRARIDLVWNEVRAGYRIDTPAGYNPALPDADLTSVPGIDFQAREFRTRDALLNTEVDTGGFGQSNSDIPAFTLVAVEAEQYERIVSGTATEVLFPVELRDGEDPAGIGTQENPVPAILPSSWPEDAGDRPERGDVLQFSLIHEQFNGSPSVFVEVIDYRATYLGVTEGVPFVVLPWEAMLAALAPQQPRELRPTTLYLGGEDVPVDELRAAINEQALDPLLSELRSDVALGVDITSRADQLEELRAAPLARGLTNSFRLSTALAALYGGLVVIIALVLTAHERARDLGYLRTLGLDPRQALGMTLVETIPGVLLACGLGIPLGIGIARLVEPGLDLRAFVGPETPVAVVANNTTAALVAAGLAAVALTSVAVFSILARRVQLGEVLRVGDR